MSHNLPGTPDTATAHQITTRLGLDQETTR